MVGSFNLLSRQLQPQCGQRMFTFTHSWRWHWCWLRMVPQSHLPHQLSPHCRTHTHAYSGPCNPTSCVWRVLSLSYSVTREMWTIPIRLWKQCWHGSSLPLSRPPAPQKLAAGPEPSCQASPNASPTNTRSKEVLYTCILMTQALVTDFLD